MRCPDIKVEVIAQFKNEHLAEILPLGFQTVVFAEVSDEDKKVSPTYFNNRLLSLGYMIPKGNFERLLFVGANGATYSDHWLYCYIGFTPINVFRKMSFTEILIQKQLTIKQTQHENSNNRNPASDQKQIVSDSD